jgi:predicted nucleic acid-binding protein
MTTISSTSSAVQSPFDNAGFDEAQLAAASFLARYSGRTLEQSIAATTVVPVSDALLTATAELRHACRQVGHALHEPVHSNDLWIAASAVHIGAPLLTADAVFDEVPGLNLHRKRPPAKRSGATFGDAPPACGGSADRSRAPCRYVRAFGDTWPRGASRAV